MRPSVKTGLSFGVTSGVITMLGLMVGLRCNVRRQTFYRLELRRAVLLAPLPTAVLVSVLWGLSLLALLSFVLARAQRIAPWKVIGEHLVIALCVVTVSHYVGDWIQAWNW
jgi:CBS-domain-containing membrane protein